MLLCLCVYRVDPPSMYISRLEVRQLRNLTSVSISPCQGINIVEGLNASGKTSLLESIHLLCLARSFRTLRTSHIVQHGCESLTLFAEFSGEQHHRLGMQRFTDNRIEMRLNGNNLYSRAELANLVPLLLLTPESTQLLTGSPRGRRQYLDWMMFHVEPSFHSHWLNFQRTLKQRNSLLRSRRVMNTLQEWDRSLITFGEQIDLMRKTIFKELVKSIKAYLSLILPDQVISLHYKQGWRLGSDFSTALGDSLATDSKLGITSVGPHRCDLVFEIDRRPASEVLSRGQLKLFVVALHLAQMSLLTQQTGKQSIVLIDDLPAELDETHRRLLLKTVETHCHQAFITATDRTLVTHGKERSGKVFHVEHGNFKEVV